MQSRFAEHYRLLALALLSLVFAVRLEAVQVLHDSVPPAVRNLTPVGRLPAEARLTLAIGLPLRNEAALTNLLEQLYDPASPSYRRWLTPEEFAQRFCPTEEDYQAVVQFAKAQGFTVLAMHSNRRLLDVRASVGQIEKAFHVAMRVYQHPKESRRFFAPASEPSLDLGVAISSIAGLNDYVLPRPANLVRKPGGKDNGPIPLAGSGPNGSYIGRDFRAAYAPNISLAGTGQYVGLVQFDGYYANDIASYVAQAGLTNVPLINVLLDGTDGSAGVNNVEVALDIEMAIAMAPALAGVVVYEGLIGNDILNRMATDNLAKQLSASWTFHTDATTPGIFQQFATQGQSYFNASGDSGAWSGTIASPCDSPFITSVGGTTLSTRGPGLGWLSETAWNWASTGSGNGATGGGISTTTPMPVWQQGINMSTNLGSTTMRNIPDVAMVADNVFVIADNGQQQFVGGTSVASPLWAAYLALVNQQAAIAGQPSVGFINPTVYSIGLSTNFTAAFRDVRTGNNTNSSSPTRFYAVQGYDLCTGWGTPAGKNLINALAPPINAPVVIGAGSTLTLETCGPTNAAIDPGEVVVVSFSLQNIGGVNTTNLIGTLLDTNGIAAISPPQSYGALVGLGAAVSRQFTFTAAGDCGSTIHPVLQLQDGPTNLGLVSFNLPLGAPVGVYTQKFDSVTAPVLPPGWTSSSSGGVSNWVTSAALRDSLPNSAFAFESTNAGLCELVSPEIPISTASAQLVFRNNYNTEVDPSLANQAFDGGVLEMKIGSGSFMDILTAGGSFASGGYTRTIQTAENPLDRRLCWGGASGGFLTTTVNLPAAAAGQPVQFKWTFGTDIANGYGGTGWYIDSVIVKDGFSCCTPSSLADVAVSQTVYPTPALVGQTIAFTLTVTSLGPGPAMAARVTDVLPANAAFYYASPGYTNNLDGTISWNLGFFPLGRTTNLLVLVTPTLEGSVTNTAFVASSYTDPDPDNSSTTNVTTIYAAPAIVNPPLTQTALPGANVTFAVSASGSEPLSYQWTFNGTNLSGQTAASLLLTNIQFSDAGPYGVVISNLFGSISSLPVNLRVLIPPAISLSSLGVTSTNVSIAVQTAAGLNYTLEYKDTLTDPAWIPLEPSVLGTGEILLLQDTNAPAQPSRFYRVNCN
jgi:uncharacterized repeat protein (TIGR01451 family)